MKKILLPTDFSNNALNAIKYAIYLFEKEPCSFYVLNAHQVDSSRLKGKLNKERNSALYEANAEESKQKLGKLVRELSAKKENPNHGFESISVSDSVLNAIGSTIINKDVDYTFMGTKGSSGMKGIFMGSNTVNALKSINFCPIVAVPGNYSFDLPDEIVFVTDFKHFYEKAELRPLIELAELWNSMIVVVHINKEKQLSEYQKKSRNLLKRRLKGLSHRFEDVEPSSTIFAVIDQFSKQNKNVGMIAMMKRRHSFFEKLIHEPVITKVAYKAELPFLVLPEIE